MGDECGDSTADSMSYKDRGPMNWKTLKTTFFKEVTGFISFLTQLRSRRGDIFQRREFLKLENIHWYESDLSEPLWEDPSSSFLCMHIIAEMKMCEIQSQVICISASIQTRNH
jgi:isoamylase